MRNLPKVRTEINSNTLGGGIDEFNIGIRAPASGAIAANNYESLSRGGYARIDGYERFDGLPSPSDAKYYYAEVIISTADSLNGIFSGS